MSNTQQFPWPQMQNEFISTNRTPASVGSAYYFVFEKNEILHQFDNEGQWLPQTSIDESHIGDAHYMGELSGIACFAFELKLGDSPKGNLRTLIGKVDSKMFNLLGRASQILDWYRTHQFCGRCGKAAELHPLDRAMVCEPCNIHSYPRISPSIITLVHDGDRILLARNHNFPSAMYSTLAGFVEPGESIEETVHREVFEEVGVKIKNLEYLGSQSWPFPNSLMLGFLAEYNGGDIVLQEEEIADAQWFSYSDLPNIPGKIAISRWIIDTYLSRQGIQV